ncbi:MAG: carboxypeptidase-like regulatory domain-containing protein, partial [Chitinophagales bacterium]
MKALSFFILFGLISIESRAQTGDPIINLKGTVLDSTTGKPLAFATLVLQNANTKAAVKNFFSKDDGKFELAVTDSLNYLLVIAFTGFDNKIIPIVRGQSSDLGSIALKPSGKELNEVTVVGIKPVIKRDLDGITYDVSADPETPTLNALDMMRKVPLLSVDASDNIRLKGKGNFKILINGKESALMAKNPSDVLRTMPATNIERIEVITTPPAKYDAEGIAGIINIITKRKLSEGYNIGLNGRLNTVWGPGINLNGTYKKDKFGLSGYVGYNVRHEQTNGIGSEQKLFSDNSTRTQDGFNTVSAHNMYGSLELSYEIDSLNLLNGSIEFYSGKFYQNSNQLSEAFNSNNSPIQAYRLLSGGDNAFGGLDASMNYQLGFKNDKNRLLTLSYKYSYSPNTQQVNNTITDT